MNTSYPVASVVDEGEAAVVDCFAAAGRELVAGLEALLEIILLSAYSFYLKYTMLYELLLYLAASVGDRASAEDPEVVLASDAG